MKKKIYIVVAISLLACTINILQIKEIKSFPKILLYSVNSIRLQNDEDRLENNIKEESQQVHTVKNKNTKNVTDDRQEIGIIITNDNSEIYHKEITFTSAGEMTLLGDNYALEGDRLTITPKDDVFIKNKKVEIISDKDISIEGKSKYRGKMVIYKTKYGMVICNRLSISDYLYSVVASEMPSSFELEALKAQAVCARTYTYAHMNNEKYIMYDAIMDDTVSYQAYGEYTDSSIVSKAVNDTKNQILTFKGKLINAYYFSTSCGYTTNGEIWNAKNLQYLKGKYVSSEKAVINVSAGDYFQKYIKEKGNSYEQECQFYRWNVVINNESIVEGIHDVLGKKIDDIEEIHIEKRGSGGIVSEIVIQGENKKIKVKNQNQIRKIFNPYGENIYLNDGSVRTNLSMLPSAFFVIEKVDNSEYKIFGGGFGHGSGMSQNGANEMAKEGYKYDKILEFFYEGATCDQKTYD